MGNLDEDGDIVDPYEAFIAKSRYSRWLEDKGRRETWSEAVDRVIDFFENDLRTRVGYDVDKELIEEVRDAIKHQEVMPSMRVMMTAGPALERNHIAAYNCSYLPVDDLRAFDETLLILMQGTGLGYSVDRDQVNRLPKVADTFVDSSITIIVEDSKEGWAAGYRSLIEHLWDGYIPSFDTSKVRPAGARLKTFGGRASGPAPLVDLFNHTIKVVRGAEGRKITPLEAHSIMCKIADVVVVGGVRRSALICLSNLDDQEMALAKSGEWWVDNPHFALANNSAIYYGKPTKEEFWAEWTTIRLSGSGERGIFNLDASIAQANKNGRRYGELVEGTNPCCVLGSTTIMTTEGPRTIESLKGQPFDAVVNGQKHHAPHGSWISGVGQVYKLETKEGYELMLTPEHRILTASGDWVEAQNLLIGDKIQIHNHKNWHGWGRTDNFGDGYLLGLFVGDGNFGTASTSGKKVAEVKVWDEGGVEKSLIEVAEKFGSELDHRSDWKGFRHHKTNPYSTMSIGDLPAQYGINQESKHDISSLEAESSEFYKGFLRGLFDADGHVEGCAKTENHKGFSVRLGQSDKELLKVVQRMLLRLGIRSTIAKAKDVGKSLLPDGKGGKALFDTKESFRLIISADSAKRFVDEIGFCHETKAQKCEEHFEWRQKIYHKPFLAEVKSFEFVGEVEVWDAEVSDVHAFDANGIYAHNSEILLRANEFCNLTEVIVRPEDSLLDLMRKVRIATILGTWQSTLTDIKYLRPIWKANIEEERLLGVSLTGQLGHPDLSGASGNSVLITYLDTLKLQAVATNKAEAGKIGIPQSTAITCVKPSGTVSQLNSVSSGMHPWHSEYYIRTVRGDNKDPITQLMQSYNVPNEPDVMNPENTTVFSFPRRAPEGALTRKDLSAVEHLELWLTYQRHWCEHKPSVTISVRDEEWDEVGEWVWDHFDEVSGVSFLPFSDHTYEQAPYQDCSKEVYEELLKKMPENIHWADLSYYEQDDSSVNGSQELACSSNQGCEAVDILK